jgi:hypothetical protein
MAVSDCYFAAEATAPDDVASVVERWHEKHPVVIKQDARLRSTTSSR